MHLVIHITRFKLGGFNTFTSTVILSFLKRERERTVNVILQSLQTVYLVQYDRFIPFTLPDRSPFLAVHRSWPFTVPDRSPFLTVTMTVPDRS
jgi:hypothetical protein